MAHLANLTINISANTNTTAVDPLIRANDEVVEQAVDAYVGSESALAEVDAAMQLTDDDIDALAQQALELDTAY